MNCQCLFSWKNKKNIVNLSSAELAQRVVKVIMVSPLKNLVFFVCSDDLSTL